MTMKKLLIGFMAAAMVTTGFATIPTTTASAKTTYLPSNIRKHVWHRKTSGTEGGFNDLTTFKVNKLKIKIVGHTYHWRLTGLKKHSKTIYYGRLHFNWKKSNKGSKLVKIKIQNKKKFDIIQKHFLNLHGNYTGNESYGAMIFKR